MVPKDDGFDEEELIRSEFDSIVSGLSLDESAPSTYLDELDRIDRSEGFVAPNPSKKASGNGGGVPCLPDVMKYPKPKKPLVLYDDEGNGDCKKVRVTK